MNLDELPEVSFTDDFTLKETSEFLFSKYAEKYEELTGKKIALEESSAEWIQLNAITLLMYQMIQWVERIGQQNTFKKAYGIYLDELAAKFGISRKPAESAKCTLHFKISEIQGNTVVIPKGTQAIVDNMTFETEEYGEILAGESSVNIPASCTIKGKIGNLFMPGSIHTLAQPLAYVSEVFNTDVSYGGADIESDEELRERLFQFVFSLSEGGADGYYQFHTKNCLPGISDVKCDTSEDGVVDIRLIFDYVRLPKESELEYIQKYLTQNSIKLQTDKVVVNAPDLNSYKINLTYYIAADTSANIPMIQEKVEKAVESYKQWQGAKIGKDINPSKLIAMIMDAGAARVEVLEPAWTEVGDLEIATNSEATIIYGGMIDD